MSLLRNLITVSLLFTFSFVCIAEEKKEAVEVFKDGIRTTLTDTEIAELEDWAQDSKKELDYLKLRVENYNDNDEILDIYDLGVRLITKGDPGLNALKMRKFLNRALQISEAVKSEDGSRSADKFRIKVFEAMVDYALAFYISDIEFLKSTGNHEKQYFAALKNLFDTLVELSKDRETKLRRDARYAMTKIVAGHINVDMYDSNFATLNAFEIEKLNKLVSDELDKRSESEVKLILGRALKNIAQSSGAIVSGDNVPLPIQVTGGINTTKYDSGVNRLTEKEKIENFNACYDFYHAFYYSNTSTNRCLEVSREFRFINNPNFDKCTILLSTYTNDYRIEQCVDQNRNFSFINNENFDKCFTYYAENLYTSTAFEKCVVLSQKFQFINNVLFDRCFVQFKKAYQSYKAANICMERYKEFNF